MGPNRLGFTESFNRAGLIVQNTLFMAIYLKPEYDNASLESTGFLYKPFFTSQTLSQQDRAGQLQFHPLPD